jgi:hypothetical protein
MELGELQVRSVPQLTHGRLVLALSGWMDGGDVSTGTLQWLISALDAPRVATITGEGYYIHHFPGSMEMSTLFRPHCRIEDGIITKYRPLASRLYASPENDLLLFSGKEPHLHWGAFAEHLFDYLRQVGVEAIFFVGSFAGTVPHTREPRIWSSVSDAAMKHVLEPLGVRFSDYEGPASFATYLTTQAARYGMMMASLVAEIPAYIDGPNPKSIETMARTLIALLDLPIDLEPLRAATDIWDKRVSDVLAEEHDLRAHIGKLEADYDSDVFDTQMGDLKEWLQQRGVRVD